MVLSADVLAVLLVLACAGTVAGGRWVVDDDDDDDGRRISRAYRRRWMLR